MSEQIIELENVSKLYKLGQFGTGTLSHDLNRWWAKFRGKEDPYLSLTEKPNHDKTAQEFTWALKNINFSANQGEVLGIIGHNGAGKSTLLKILSRVTGPTTGSIKLKGRVGSLLEVGTGMHPEMTGTENIYLNGAILGMTKQEIRSKFDDIVDFAGIAKYVNTPLKRYSSGMKVRLGFAVAAFLEPEILIVDEVLAVGDLAFQQKCIEKMNDVGRKGRTILFVSHNMAAVEGLCSRAILLENGTITYEGKVGDTIEKYRNNSLKLADHKNLESRTDRDGNGAFRFTKLKINDYEPVVLGSSLKLELGYKSKKDIQNLHLAIKLSKNYREVIMTLDSRAQGELLHISQGEGSIIVSLPAIQLMPGAYFIDLWAGDGKAAEDRIFNAAKLTILDADIYETGNSMDATKHGVVVAPKCNWVKTANEF